jgi:hypothetical protein
MLGNDRNREAISGTVAYIEGVGLDENFGLIIFNHEVFTLHYYGPLETEEAREELIEIVENTPYDGGTDIHGALMAAMRQIRECGECREERREDPDRAYPPCDCDEDESPDNPGLVLLFSDGESPIDFYELENMSAGDTRNPRNRIPINTIYLGPASDYWFGGTTHMERIADMTGGVYMPLRPGDAAIGNMFNESLNFWRRTELNLLSSRKGEFSFSPLRIILHGVFFVMWGILSGLMVVLFLNNNRLWKHYFVPKIIVTVVFAAVAAALFAVFGSNPRPFFDISLGIFGFDFAGVIPRLVLVAGLCVMYPPTYNWDGAPR